MESTDKVIITIRNNGHVSFEFDPVLKEEERNFRSEMADELLAVFKEDEIQEEDD